MGSRNWFVIHESRTLNSYSHASLEEKVNPNILKDQIQVQKPILVVAWSHLE